jgi:peptidoglycan/xylan/chitin deacetylase (PgdA/CDA1 family)
MVSFSGREGRRAGWLMRGGVLGVALISMWALTAAVPRSALAADRAPYQAQVFERGYDTSKVVTLSFDGDWSAAGVPTVLQVLRDNGITAAFGLTGRFAERYPSDAKAIVAAGHKLLNHSYSHPYFSQLTQAQRWAELDRAESVYAGLGLSSGHWFRTPYRDAYTDPGVNRDLALRGYYINFDWTYDTTGYQGASLDVILNRVRQYTVPGGIVLMHVGEGSTDPQYLPTIISTLRGMGYSFTNPYQTLTRGAIRDKWLALGGWRSAFGAPRTPDMIATTTGTAVQWFQNGRIYWRQGYPAVYMYGAILGKYQSMGTVYSGIGLPITDELGAPNGGRYNDFQYANSSIYWTASTGPHLVLGAIKGKWMWFGGPGGYLGYPISDEAAAAVGRVSRFQRGNIYWTSTYGPHVVYGAILARYLSLGGPASRLGAPVSDEYWYGGNRRTDFQHGAIIYNWTTGATSVIYY